MTSRPEEPTSSDGQQALSAQYRKARAAAPPGGRVAILQLGADDTGVAVGADEAPDATLTLAIGSRRTAMAHFKHAPPTPEELELAIMTVEDEVTRALGMLGGLAELYTAEASIRAMARAAGAGGDGDIVLSVEHVERTFERLAAVSLGRPAAREGLPADSDFAATLLIVREFMHHLGFARLTILAG